jgi:predicted unusual protein kinase regulating ubiquinone biosynthesis (AarF/ABC1/UbiB family)
MTLFETKQDALAPTNGAALKFTNGNHTNGENAASAENSLNGNGHRISSETDAPPKKLKAQEYIDAARAQASTLRGWLRTLQIVRVIGTLALYLYLASYDVRYKFNRRAAAYRLERARERGRRALIVEKCVDALRLAFDKFVRIVRRIVFRGLNGAESKTVRLEKQAVWLRENLIGLGPTFIKIGQTLGTRADLLPLAYIKELSTLQDQVPPFPTAEAFARIESELGKPIGELYAEIDAEPIAAASLGQVYRARLHTGEEVAVKVQRPALRETIDLDIAILHRIAQFAARFPALSENTDWDGMLREFAETIHEEMNYAQEARNAERFRDNFRDWRVIHVPKIYWSHTSERVLTMEFIRGTRVVDVEALLARRISPIKVNRLLVKTYLKQLLEDGFFHADPHPGNLLVMDDGRLAFFDFGMTGRITPRLQSQMVDAFFHVVGRDVPGIAQDLINLNFLKSGVDPEKVRPVVESLFEHYLNLKLGEVNFKELTYELADVIYEYPFRLPSNFTYIIRALMTLEGIGLVTDPEFSFFETARPFAKEFTLKREGKHFRKLLLDKLTGRDGDGKIEWGKMWKLAKMAAKLYLEKQ